MTPCEPRQAHDPRVARVVAAFESLSPESVADLGALYAHDARFRDPFNDVRGLPAIQRIFTHMFATLEAPRFHVSEALAQGNRACLVWDLEARLRGRPLRIHGSTLLHFGPDGRVRRHRDYWDAAEEFYEKLPLLGALLRALRRRLRAG